MVHLHVTPEITRLENIDIPIKEFPVTFICWKGSRFIFRAISANFYNLFRIQMWFTPLGILLIHLGFLLHVHSLILEIWKSIGQRHMLMVTHIFILISVPFYYNVQNNNTFRYNINHTHKLTWGSKFFISDFRENVIVAPSTPSTLFEASINTASAGRKKRIVNSTVIKPCLLWKKKRAKPGLRNYSM